jgi:hypothetical protein
MTFGIAPLPTLPLEGEGGSPFNYSSRSNGLSPLPKGEREVPAQSAGG